METIDKNYLANIKKLFRYYKSVGDNAFSQIAEDNIHWQHNPESNSIATIVKHISGNSISRWTDFLTSDGEKDWRDRDDEFEDTIADKQEMIRLWESGWQCLLDTLDSLHEDDLMKIIYIRNEGQTVVEAINRQLAHLPYHVGQIVFIAKYLTGPAWLSPTIPKGKSNAFNTKKFSQEKTLTFFKNETEQ